MPLAARILIAWSLCFASASCSILRPAAPKVVYLPEGDRILHLEAGQVAPFNGFLVAPGAMLKMGGDIAKDLPDKPPP